MEDRTNIRHLAAALAHRGDVGTDAAQVAQLVATACAAIEAALTPIIGGNGLAALHRRSLHMASRGHPCLSALGAHDPSGQPLFAPLRSTLAAQDGPSAAQAGAAYLQTLNDLLASLIGPSLTERLLRRAWLDLMGAMPGQEHET